jgi:hypothetical protein
MFYKLNKGEHEEALAYARKLNVDIEETWNTDWFNHAIHVQEHFIKVDYETCTSYGLPLNLLNQLFASGLIGAAIEIFHDQAGEYTRHFFFNGKLVAEGYIYSKISHAKKVLKTHFDASTDELEPDEIDKPISLNELIKQERQNRKDAEDAVDALRSIVGIAKDSSSNPMEILKGILLLRASAKGLLYAFFFGLVTFLLFKGFWLWITLSILLAIVLAWYNMHKVFRELDPQNDEENEMAAEVDNVN